MGPLFGPAHADVLGPGGRFRVRSGSSDPGPLGQHFPDGYVLGDEGHAAVPDRLDEAPGDASAEDVLINQFVQDTVVCIRLPPVPQFPEENVLFLSAVGPVGIGKKKVNGLTFGKTGIDRKSARCMPGK